MGYHPTLGRFLQRDPKGHVDGMNLYEYCRSHPTAATDPTGLSEVTFTGDPKSKRRMRYEWVECRETILSPTVPMPIPVRRHRSFLVAQRVKTAAVDGWLVPTAGLEWEHQGLPKHHFKYDIVVKDRQKLKSLLLENPAPSFRRTEEALLWVIAFHQRHLGEIAYVDRQGKIVDRNALDTAARMFHDAACDSARKVALRNSLPVLGAQALVNWLLGHANALLAQVNALQVTRPNSSFAGVLETQVSLRAALGKEVATRSQTARLAARASEYHMALEKPHAQTHRTTAILQADDKVIVGSGARDLGPAQTALARSDEILAKLPGAHAELTVLTKARALGLSPKELIATKAFCPSCRAYLEKAGAKIVGPQRAVWP